LEEHDVSLGDRAIAGIDVHGKPLESGRWVSYEDHSAGLSNLDARSGTGNAVLDGLAVDISGFSSGCSVNSKIGRERIDGQKTAHFGTSEGDEITDGKGD